MNEAFAKDFINLQSEIQTMPKDKSGYGYKYTDLDTIITNLKPLMKNHNIGFSQLLRTDNGVTGIETTIIHTSGDTLGSFVAIPEIQVGKANNAQNIGAAITYFKRYALSALFGISSDEDVDCSTQIMDNNKKQMNAAESKKSPNLKDSKTSSVKSSENTTKKFTKEQGQKLAELMKTTNADGTNFFSDEAKAHYRALLMDGGFERAFKEASALIELANHPAEQEPLF